uniref:Putative secreted protein n=1 Tax=Anopheles darlingi TaxID=43151 RepID=A0A2M4D0H1_ANODA
MFDWICILIAFRARCVTIPTTLSPIISPPVKTKFSVTRRRPLSTSSSSSAAAAAPAPPVINQWRKSDGAGLMAASDRCYATAHSPQPPRCFDEVKEWKAMVTPRLSHRNDDFRSNRARTGSIKSPHVVGPVPSRPSATQPNFSPLLENTKLLVLDL